MKPIVEKMLNSGLVDKATARIMEQWGFLPEGSVEKTKEDALKNATRDELVRLAEDLATEAEKAHAMRETSFDLDRIRWPAEVSILNENNDVLVHSVTSVVDRFGRYYFNMESQPSWFVPGFTLKRKLQSGLITTYQEEMITESQTLYIDEQPVCIQVATKKV